MTHSPVDDSNRSEEAGKPVPGELPASERPASPLPPLPEPDKRIDLDEMPNLPPLPVAAHTERQAELPPLPTPGDYSGKLPELPGALNQDVKSQLSSSAETPDNEGKSTLPVLPVAAATEEQTTLPPVPNVEAASAGLPTLPALPGILNQEANPQMSPDVKPTDNGGKQAFPPLPSLEVKSAEAEESVGESDEERVPEKSETEMPENEKSDKEAPLAEKHLHELKQSNPPRMPAIPVLPVLEGSSEQGNPPATIEDTVGMGSGEVEKLEDKNEDVIVEQAPYVREEEKATAQMGQTLEESESNLPGDGQSTSTDSATDGPARVQETELDIPDATDMQAAPSNGDPQPESQEEMEVELPQQSQAAQREPVMDQGFLGYMGSIDDGDCVKLLALPQIIAHWVASADGQVDMYESMIIHRILKDGAMEIDEEFQNLRWKNQAEVNKWIESVLPKDLPSALRARFDVLLMPLDEYRAIFETMPKDLRERFGKFVSDICTEVAEASDEGNGVAEGIGLEEKLVIQLIRESLGIDAPEPLANED